MRHRNEHSPKTPAAAEIWNKRYAACPSWWKGPYDMTHIMQYITPGVAVLDVGCGTGRYLLPLDRAGFAVVGLDLSRTALRLLPRHLVRIVGDVQAVPLADQSVDACTCYGVLQHLSKGQRVRAVIELFRVLKCAGVVFIEVVGVRDMRYGSGVQEEEGTFARQGIRCHYFSASELSQLFVSAGFSVLKLEERLAKKSYHGIACLRHRILLVAQRPVQSTKPLPAV
ncbi:MAG: class I SAM-dependent methyltransferase [Halobacteriota archaeon]